MSIGCLKRLVAVVAGVSVANAAEQQLDEVLVTARRVPENAQDVPIALSTFSAERLADYQINTLEKLSATLPDLILTRGNSGSGMSLSLRGIGPNFSSIGIEQSVAVVVDEVYYGQGRVIDEALVDVTDIEVLKGPQSLFFGKNSTAGVISITSANPGPQFESHVRVGYEFATQNPQGELVISGPVTPELGLRLVVYGQDMVGGYVRNVAPAGSYATIDAAAFTSTVHYVPAPDPHLLPAENTLLGRLTATYHPSEAISVTLKADAEGNGQGGTSWNDRLWKCPQGHGTFPGNGPQPCGDGFQISQNPVPPDIAATRPDMARDGGQLYADYESRGLTALIDAKLSPIDLASITNYQHFDYTNNSDYDFTAVPQIWSDQHNSYRAVSQELRARTNTESPLGFLGGLYYQNTALSFAQSAVFYGSEDSLASPSNRYVSVLKDSATDGQTFSGYGQVIWRFVPAWELTAGARFTRETKSSYFVQPYVNPFFAALYAPNDRLSAAQHFHNASPEVTLSWKPVATAMLYAAYRTGYKSGGFSNSADDVVNSAGVRDLTFKPETAHGAEAGLKMTLLRVLRLNLDVYDYRFDDLQVDFFNAQNFALITTNAGAARSEGVEVQGQYAVTAIQGMGLHGSVNYNVATYQSYIGPCYGGQTQSQGCNIVGPAPDHATLQDLSGRATADSPKWTGTIGIDYERPASTGWLLAAMADMRLSSRYSVSPFAQPLDIQPAYATVDVAIRLSTANERWQTALIGKNLTNRFVVTFAGDEPSTGTSAGGVTGRLADQYAIFAPARTVELQFTYKH